MFVLDVHRLPGSLLCHPESGFHRCEEFRGVSEKAFVDWQYQEKLSRARNSKSRNCNVVTPGDLYSLFLEASRQEQAKHALRRQERRVHGPG